MDRTGAIVLLKELLFSVGELQTRSFALLSSDAFDIPSQGYKIYIKDDLDAYSIASIRELAQKHGLTLIEKENRLIIYIPITAEEDNVELTSAFPLYLKTAC